MLCAEIISTDSELARKIGISRQLLHWHRKYSNAPVGRNLTAWREYLTTFGRVEVTEKINKENTDNVKNIYKSRCRSIELQNERIKMGILIVRKSMIPKVTVEKIFSSLVTSLRNKHIAASAKIADLARNTPNQHEAANLIRQEIIKIWQSESIVQTPKLTP